MHHELKTWPSYFTAILDGSKNFDIRNNKDRGFQKGDTVRLREYDPGITVGTYTGRMIEKRVTYVTAFEQKPDFVVLALADL